MSDETKKITNTTAEAATTEGQKKILMEALFNQMLGRRPGQDIEDMEARGQRELCESASLPTDFNEYGDRAGRGRAALEAAGVRFLGEVEGDSLFQRVELPAGWTIKPTEHSMWSELLDDQGRKRAAVFYKAAFYDRKAHIDVLPRFSYRLNYPDDFEQGFYSAVVYDGGAVVWTSKEFQNSEIERGSDLASGAAQAFLDAEWPEWRDPRAYWA